jgi:hypothetical protein
VQRWVNRDPIEELGGNNLYEYVGNSPVNLQDHRGLFACSELISKLSDLLKNLGLGDLEKRQQRWSAQKPKMAVRLAVRQNHRPTLS